VIVIFYRSVILLHLCKECSHAVKFKQLIINVVTNGLHHFDDILSSSNT